MTPSLPRAPLCAAALTAALGGLAAASLAPPAQAAFTTGKCLGSDVLGRGASFARDAQRSWRFNFENNYCADVGSFPTVTYDAAGSGAGRASVKTRDAGGPRFAGTDEPPTAAEVADMNNGVNDVPGDEDRVHVIPGAVGAVAPLVNFPNDCDVASLPVENQTAPGSTTNTNRVRFTKSQFEKVWAADTDADTWGEVFPTIRAIVGNTAGRTDAQCAAQAIKRVRRADGSGTTFTLKDYLDRINPARGWLTTYNPNPNTVWPNEASSPTINGTGSGNGPLVTRLIAEDGSVGYSDISTARAGGLAVAPTADAAARDNDVYWTQAQNGSGTFTEPTADAGGYQTTGNRGANCRTVTFTGLPDSTFGDWERASGVNSPQGFGICTLTYVLAFDDHAKAYGNFDAATEERKARTVKDYLSAVVSEGGQAVLFQNDYAPLPENIRQMASAGVASIGWQKTAGGGGGTAPPAGDTPTPPPANPGSGEAPPPAGPVDTVGPAMAISRRPVTASRTGIVRVSLRCPAAEPVCTGTVRLVARINRRNRTLGRKTFRLARGQTVRVSVRLSRTNLALLRRLNSVRVTASAVARDQAGNASTTTARFTLREPRR